MKNKYCVVCSSLYKKVLLQPGEKFFCEEHKEERERNLEARGVKENPSRSFMSPSFIGKKAEDYIQNRFQGQIECMPGGNPSFDFRTPDGVTIDVKGAALDKSRKSWHFALRWNQVVDFFILVFYDDPYAEIPIRVWAIPGKKLNHLGYFGVRYDKDYSKTWGKYNQLDDILRLEE